MRTWNTVAIIGVGLIGGSIGLALRRRGRCGQVVGIGRRETTLQEALRRDSITEATTDLERGVRDAELTIVCTPVSKIAGLAKAAANACPASALVTDAGSIKEKIVAQVGDALQRDVGFVGSHPLAGSEQTGPGAAREDLFEGRIVVVTPTETTRDDHVRTVAEFWTSIGASVIHMSPAEHDQALALTSHLPHVVASLLAASTPLDTLDLVASGWLDSTRVASGNVDLWHEIIEGNRGNMASALHSYSELLDSFRSAVEQGDSERLRQLLQRGKERRDAVGSRHTSGTEPT